MTTLKPIVDDLASRPGPEAYWFLGVSGTATITGFFVGADGSRVGNSFSLSVNQAGSGVPVTFANVPPGAVGAKIYPSAAVYYDIKPGSAYDADFNANYANYPRFAATTVFDIGRCR